MSINKLEKQNMVCMQNGILFRKKNEVVTHRTKKTNLRNMPSGKKKQKKAAYL